MKITLNLATRPYADQGPALKRLRIGMGVLAVVLVGLGLGLLHFHQTALKMAAQQDALDQSIARVQQEQRGYQAQMQQPANAKVLTQAQFLNHLFDEKSFSWTAAMENLEQVLPGGVQVTSLEPSRGKDGRLTLRLRISGDRERSVEMVRNMEHSPRFAQPRVIGENSENANAQGGLPQLGVQAAAENTKVNFEILAEYNPPTLAERRAELVRHGRGTEPSRQPVNRNNRPGYIPPIHPVQSHPIQPARQPVAGMANRPVSVPRPGIQNMPPQMAPRTPSGPPEEMPSGYDPSGLKNHDQNRIPPPGYIPTQPNQQPNNPGGAR